MSAMDDKRPGYHIIDVPVIDGVATLPDGRTVRSSGHVIRVPIADNLPTAAPLDGPDCGVDGCEREIGHTGDHAPHDSLDYAWAEAEAALPEGCTLRLEHDPSVGDLPSSAAAVADVAWRRSTHVDAESPAAALRALALKLRERAG